MNFHITEIEDADYPDNPEEFARAMRLESISLWTEELPDCDSIVMDYMIDREKSDEILAVKLFADGGICGIDWES